MQSFFITKTQLKHNNINPFGKLHLVILAVVWIRAFSKHMFLYLEHN